MIQILFGIWLYLLKQSCREFHGEQFFFLLQPLKRFVKVSKISFKLFGEKKFKKKEKGTCAAGPTRLTFSPARQRGPLPLPSLSRARCPPRSTRRRPLGGRTPALDAPRPTGLTWSERHPARRRAILSPRSSLSSSSAHAHRSSSSSAAAPSPEKLRCSPPATPVPQPRCQDHQRTRRRRGKPLRTLYRGESPSYAVNRSPELLRPCRRAPPRRISPVPISFCSLLCALGP